MNISDRLQSDGTPGGTTLQPAEERAIQGEEALWWNPTATAGMMVTERTALQLAPFFTGVSVVSGDVSILPLNVYQEQANGGRKEVREHAVAELFGRSPDGISPPARWKQAWMGHALLFGDGYAEIQRKGRGTPYALHILDPSTTHARDSNGRPGYEIDGGWLPASNVLHIAGLGFDGRCGYNLVNLIKESIAVGLAAQGYSADYFANGSEPGGVIETPEKLGPEGRRNLKDGWELRHGGPGKRHGVAVLEKGATWKGVSVDPEKAQLLEVRKYQALDSVRALRVPPNKVGDYSEAHLNNISAANLDYLMTALMRWLVEIEQECTLKLFTREEWRAGFYLEHDTDAILRGDILTSAQADEMDLRSGVKNRDEVRRKRNLNPIGKAKGGKIHTIQAQNIPLEQAGQASPKPGKAGNAPAPTPAPAAEDTTP